MDNNFIDFKNFLLKNGISNKSVKFYVSDVRLFVKWIEKTTNESTITKELFESYESFLKNSGLPTKSINRKLSSLRKFAEYLIKNRLMETKSKLRLKNSPKNNIRHIDLTKSMSRYIPTSNISLFSFLFLLIIISGVIFVSAREENGLFKTTTHGVNINLPVSISFQNDDYQKNLGKAAISGTKTIELDDDPVLRGTSEGDNFGKSEIEVGLAEKKIFVPNINASSYVFLTSFSNNHIYIKEQSDGFFTVGTDKLSDLPIKFNWMVATKRMWYLSPNGN